MRSNWLAGYYLQTMAARDRVKTLEQTVQCIHRTGQVKRRLYCRVCIVVDTILSLVQETQARCGELEKSIARERKRREPVCLVVGARAHAYFWSSAAEKRSAASPPLNKSFCEMAGLPEPPILDIFVSRQILRT